MRQPDAPVTAFQLTVTPPVAAGAMVSARAVAAWTVARSRSPVAPASSAVGRGAPARSATGSELAEAEPAGARGEEAAEAEARASPEPPPQAARREALEIRAA